MNMSSKAGLWKYFQWNTQCYCHMALLLWDWVGRVCNNGVANWVLQCDIEFSFHILTVVYVITLIIHLRMAKQSKALLIILLTISVNLLKC